MVNQTKNAVINTIYKGILQQGLDTKKVSIDDSDADSEICISTDSESIIMNVLYDAEEDIYMATPWYDGYELTDYMVFQASETEKVIKLVVDFYNATNEFEKCRKAFEVK